jgi:hypothetical protein
MGVDIVSADGEMFLAREVVEMARRGARGFRLLGSRPLGGLSWNDLRGKPLVRGDGTPGPWSTGGSPRLE